MSLNAKHLQSVAKNTIITKSIKELARKMFGPSFSSISDDIEVISKEINECIYECVNDGREFENLIKPSMLLMLENHASDDVRKMVVQLLPEELVKKFVNDKSDVVRFYVAQRVDHKTLQEMKRLYPRDQLLELVCSSKRITNEAVKKEEPEKVELEKADLSDVWYETQAQNILRQYGEFSHSVPRSIERHWNPLAVKRFCSATRATSGVVIDQERLQKAVDDALEKLDVEYASPIKSFKELKDALLDSLKEEKLYSTPVLIDFNEEQINESYSELTDSNIIKQFESKFNVQKYKFQPTFAQLCEHVELHNVLVPQSVDANSIQLDIEHENLFDRYTNAWNNIHESIGLKISWSPNSDKIDFSVENI